MELIELRNKVAAAKTHSKTLPSKIGRGSLDGGNKVSLKAAEDTSTSKKASAPVKEEEKAVPRVYLSEFHQTNSKFRSARREASYSPFCSFDSTMFDACIRTRFHVNLAVYEVSKVEIHPQLRYIRLIIFAIKLLARAPKQVGSLVRAQLLRR